MVEQHITQMITLLLYCHLGLHWATNVLGQIISSRRRTDSRFAAPGLRCTNRGRRALIDFIVIRQVTPLS